MTARSPAVRRLLLVAAAAASFAAAGLVLPSAAAARQDVAAQEDAGDQMGGRMGEHQGGRRSGLHAEVDRMLAVARATPEQKAKITQILKSAFQQTAELRRKAADTHLQLARLLTAQRIDRAAIERVRADHVAATDQSGRILVKAFADAAEVLTPEQRDRIAAALPEPRRATARTAR